MSRRHHAMGHAGVRTHLLVDQPPSPSDEPPQSIGSILGDVCDEEILVIGPSGLDVTCDLVRRGARSVTLLRTDKRPEAQSASLVVVPGTPSLEWLACVLGHARRALIPTGRLVLRIESTSRQFAAQVTRMLRVHGYTAIAARQSGSSLLVDAQVPAFGRQMHV
jgi:hypothetical protein